MRRVRYAHDDNQVEAYAILEEAEDAEDEN
jgi:hypothetical protein